MSKTQSTTSKSTASIECQNPDCETHGKVWEFHHGAYCSNECEHKHESYKHLRKLKHDHTVCYSCFTQLKTIEPPKPDHAFDVTGTGWSWDPENEWWFLERYGQEITKEMAVGFQHRTPEADVGEKQLKNLITTGTICDSCGNCNHTVHIPYLEDDHTVIGRVITRLDIDLTIPQIHHFHREYRATQDLALALGRVING
ncbi:hypothetical protein GCM10009000_012740 [Halobacterium noricense]|uniref:C2H2-type domain-containing protein n=1 Tax=Haladaptatus pallidirubidus TaxID=1008152 RepID=A0AAV3UBV9_9EURY